MYTSLGRRIRRVILLLAMALFQFAFNLPAHAQESLSRAIDVDVPAQPLTAALIALSRQADVEVMMSTEMVEGLDSDGVKGRMSVGDALTQLLKKSGLGFHASGEKTVWIDVPGAIPVVPAASPPPQSLADPAPVTDNLDEVAATPDEADGAANTTVTTGKSGGIAEIIVTAQKKSENIQDVPIAITALSMEDLTQRQIAGGPDLFTQVPNMSFTKTNFTGYSIQIRGIGTQAISATTDPAVAVALNNTPFLRNRFFEQEFYDLDRVEILRGPQGTLYGRNATAGVVNLITAKPSFYEEARSSMDIGNYNNRRVEQMINIPLVEDQVALRFAGEWTKRDGYSKNQLTGSPIDGRDLWSTRTSLRIKPNDRIDANLVWEHFTENDDRLRSGKQLCDKDVVTHVGDIQTPDYLQVLPGGGQQNLFSGVQATFSQGCKRNSLYAKDSFQTPNGLSLPYYKPLGSIGLPAALNDPYLSTVQSRDLRQIESTIDPQYHAKSDLGELQINFDLSDHLMLTSETGYNTDSVYSLEDFNRFNTAPGAWAAATPSTRPGLLQDGPNGGVFCDPQLGCSDRLVAVDISSAESSQFSQELRLSSSFDGPFNFSIGGNYLHYNTEDKYYVFINSLSLIAGQVNSAGHYPAPYVAGQSDNIECLPNGYQQGDPNGVYSVTNCTYIDPNPIDKVNDQGHNYFLSRNPYTLNSYALFGETYYDITSNLKLTAGLRWSVDQKEAPRIPTWILGSKSVGYPVAETVRQEWRKPTGRLVLDWKPDLSFTDETLLYGSYSRGYKAGGANPPGFVRTFYGSADAANSSSEVSATRPKTFDPEYVNAFEIGAKNTLFGGRLTANLAAFFYDYKNYQISEIVDRSAFNRNYDAMIWGAELEADWYVVDNLRLGFKGGYEKTRIDNGEKAVDLMDRTAGHEGWSVVRPFPTFASSCILPSSIFAGEYMGNPSLIETGGVGGGGPGACEIAYLGGNDPVTNLPYVPNPTVDRDDVPHDGIGWGTLEYHPGYAGFDPATAPNNGEGFDKNLGGNELPNAPNYTATLTSDYTLPLANAWTVTLHGDAHWQSKSWWRVFNDSDFGRLKSYWTMNVAAVFVNEAAGWNIMAYVKNVTDKTAISGAFLNSDDTGLTTNVFLTDPRLYGLRITKQWTGKSLPGLFASMGDSTKTPDVTLELGGQIEKVDAPNQPLEPSFGSQFAAPIDIFGSTQDKGLGWGEDREAKLSWHPDNGPWAISAAYRHGEIGNTTNASAEKYTDPMCALAGGMFAHYCLPQPDGAPPVPLLYAGVLNISMANRANASVLDREEHEFVDIALSRDWVFGGLSRSTFGLALRRARFKSMTEAELSGTPDWDIPENIQVFAFLGGNLATHTLYEATLQSRRGFEGTGPVLSWDASRHLLGNEQVGHVDLDWGVSGGALFGHQTVSTSGNERERDFAQDAGAVTGLTNNVLSVPAIVETTVPGVRRSKSVVAPTFGANLGLAYRVGGASIAAGYRWERYFNVIDGGFDEHKNYDRTIQGPHFKATIGFGG